MPGFASTAASRCSPITECAAGRPAGRSGTSAVPIFQGRCACGHQARPDRPVGGELDRGRRRPRLPRRRPDRARSVDRHQHPGGADALPMFWLRSPSSSVTWPPSEHATALPLPGRGTVASCRREARLSAPTNSRSPGSSTSAVICPPGGSPRLSASPAPACTVRFRQAGAASRNSQRTVTTLWRPAAPDPPLRSAMPVPSLLSCRAPIGAIRVAG